MRCPPPLLAAASWLAAFAVHRLIATPVLLPAPWDLLGLGVAVPGLALAAAGVRAFRARGTTVHPWRVPSAFVAGGPYRFTRNPMYLGLLLVTLGAALLVGTLAMLLAPALFFALADRCVIPWEERTLLATFGEAYAAYRTRVRRWL